MVDKLGTAACGVFRVLWVCMVGLALYMVSIPSGIMTISDVPTSTPVPRSVMMRSWREERLKESGNIPARKDLRMSVAIKTGHEAGLRTLRP